MANAITFENPVNIKEVKSKPINKNIVILLSVLLVLILAVVGYYFFVFENQQNINANIEQQQKIMAEESKKYMDDLKSVMLIDSDESPVIAKVSDAEKLKVTNPEFYKNLKVGDIVYIYSYRIIVYRPSEKKIINIAPIINTKDLQNNTSSSKT